MKRNLLSFMIMTFMSWSMYGQITTVGIIGSGTTGNDEGWNSDIDMMQTSDSTWTLDIKLYNGLVKFRANDDWAINWGPTKASEDPGFPTGIGVQDGKDIPVYDGNYTVTFNSVSGEYYFDVDSDLGIIGSATPGEWSTDTDMYIDASDSNRYFVLMTLKAGACKFRQDDDWAVNWGPSKDSTAVGFPSGIGVQDGKDIPIEKAGVYFITFNKATGEYNFEERIGYKSIGIIGTATPGGWDNETTLRKDKTNPDLWTIDLVLTDGEAKFRADSAWAVSWGNVDFPSGIGIKENGPNIPVVAGEYRIVFNSKTGAYDFKEIPTYETIGLIGTATPNGWDGPDLNLDRDATDKNKWFVRTTLSAGEAKFRANDSWDINDWGSSDFPSGVGVQFGDNISIPAGDYKITFNSFTGEYNFEAVIEFGKISLVGQSGPFGEWPGSDDTKDTYLEKDPNDPNHWTLPSVTLSQYNASTSNGIKFRAEAAWAINWGKNKEKPELPGFPSGLGVQDGDNLQCNAGTYKIDFKSDTGEYGFSDPSSTYDILSDAVIYVYPNPASTYINIDVKEDDIKGDTKVMMYDVMGKLVINQMVNTQSTVRIDAGQLNSGQYFIHFVGENFMVGRKVSILK